MCQLEITSNSATHFWWSKLLAVMTRIQLFFFFAVEVLLSYKHPSQPQRVHLFPRIYF